MRLVRLALLCALVCAAPACTSEGGAGFFIVQNNVPAEDCVIPSDTASAFLSKGTVEVDYAAGYFFTPVVQSLFTPSMNADVDHVIFVRGADISLSFPRGELSSVGTFRQMFSGSVFPDGTTSFGFDIVPREVLNDIGAAIPAEGGAIAVSAEIQMFGVADGEEVEAEPYFYNVDVCRGCIAFDLGVTCDAIPDGTVIRQGGTCDVFQDAVVDCCTDALGRYICPAPVSTGA
jgi:hypothetical protein